MEGWSGYILVKVDAAVGKLAEGSLLLELCNFIFISDLLRFILTPE